MLQLEAREKDPTLFEERGERVKGSDRLDWRVVDEEEWAGKLAVVAER